jgi:hypothetical protein
MITEVVHSVYMEIGTDTVVTTKTKPADAPY